MLDPFTLSVINAGATGRGTVTSLPLGIDCGSDCMEAYDEGMMVTLTGTPDSGSAFAGWSGGGCSGTGNCAVTMDVRRTVTATFVELLTPAVTVLSPNGGEHLDVGSDHVISWNSTGTVGEVKIEYSINSGSSWSTIIPGTVNDGSYVWTVPNAPSDNCLVRISEAGDGDPSDVSDEVFSIVSP
jgi:hypothetical protein